MPDPLDEFLAAVVPPAVDRTVASKRREAIETLLSSATGGSGYLFESGSWSHGTGIAAKSDVDYMAWMDPGRPAKPSAVLKRLRHTIDETSGLDVYNVRVSSPVVSVEFFTGPHFEIVPRSSRRTVPAPTCSGSPAGGTSGSCRRRTPTSPT